MCGISAYKGRNSVSHVLMALRNLEVRGYDSSGIASWDNGIKIMKGVGYVDNVFSRNLPHGSSAIGHVRWSTHGKVNKINAHPQIDCSGEIAICHNGVIENYEEIKIALSPQHEFQSETDTEVIAHLLEGKDLLAGVIEASALLKGENSFVVLSQGRILGSCGGPPLLVSNGELASDASALTSNDFFALRRGDVVEIVENGYKFLQGKPDMPYYLPKVKRHSFMDEKKKFSTQFLKEIWEQPYAMVSALDNDKKKLMRVCSIMQEKVILTGAGSSKVACMWAKYKFVSCGVYVDVVPAGEWMSIPVLNSQLVIMVSQSGETGTLVSLVDDISDCKKLVTVTNTAWSYLAREASELLELFCGEERSVIASKSFITECVVLGHIAAYKKYESKEFENVVRRASHALEQWLPIIQDEIDQLDIRFERCFVCGEGEFYPVAHEGAMKLKEGAYIFAEPMVASEFKHEALPLMTKGEVVLWVGETTGGGIAQVAEIRSRGAKVIGFSTTDLGFDVHIKIPVEALDFPPIAVVPIQILTHRIAQKKKINVDRPRNLAKAITVK